MLDWPTHITHRDAALAVFATLGARAQALGLVLRPTPPEPTGCCGRGCNGCVWEGFLAAATFWQDDALAAIEGAAHAAMPVTLPP